MSLVGTVLEVSNVPYAVYLEARAVQVVRLGYLNLVEEGNTIFRNVGKS